MNGIRRTKNDAFYLWIWEIASSGVKIEKIEQLFEFRNFESLSLTWKLENRLFRSNLTPKLLFNVHFHWFFWSHQLLPAVANYVFLQYSAQTAVQSNYFISFKCQFTAGFIEPFSNTFNFQLHVYGNVEREHPIFFEPSHKNPKRIMKFGQTHSLRGINARKSALI